MATLFHVSWALIFFGGFFAFQIPAWIRADYFFGNTWQQVLPWQHFFMFLGPKSFSRCSLHSRPLHELLLISFSMIPGNKCCQCCHSNTFLFLGLINIFMGSLLSIPLHRLELISTSATPGNIIYVLSNYKTLHE